MSTHGPQAGTASYIAAQREKSKALDLSADYPGVRASPELVAKLVAAKHLIGYGAPSVTLRLGTGDARELNAGDIDVLLGLCAEAFQRFDTLG